METTENIKTEHPEGCSCEEHNHSQEKEKKDSIELFVAHINRLKPEYRKLAKQAWHNQDGRCVFRDILLHKHKVIVALFRPADPSKFDGLDVIPFLVSDEHKKTPKGLIENAILRLVYSLFGIELKQEIKSLTPEEEDRIIKMAEENASASVIEENKDELIKIEG
jgi:hypothetical protein